MTHNPKIELAKRAVEIAADNHGGKFNKAQLIAASKEVFGGYGESAADPRMPIRPIKTMQDVDDAANAMAFIDGHYPAGMPSCMVVGINGGCGYGCPVFLNKDCDELGEFTSEEFEQSDHYDEDVDWFYWKCCEESPSQISELKGGE